jgi:DNA mismatch repair protein MutL
MEMLQKNIGSSQQLLFPETLELNPPDFSLVTELENEIRAVGYAFEYLGKNTIVINGVPSLMNVDSGKDVFQGVLETYKKNFLEYRDKNIENLARSMAINSGIKRGRKLGSTEMKNIIDRLFACSNANTAPNGQLIFYIIENNKIQETFNFLS